jgi:twitching motility protein PilT
MRDGEMEGMQYFDGEIEKLIRSGTVSYATGLLYATNRGNLQVQLMGATFDDDEAPAG